MPFTFSKWYNRLVLVCPNGYILGAKVYWKFTNKNSKQLYTKHSKTSNCKPYLEITVL